jgi:hypothetical protein
MEKGCEGKPPAGYFTLNYYSPPPPKKKNLIKFSPIIEVFENP